MTDTNDAVGAEALVQVPGVAEQPTPQDQPEAALEADPAGAPESDEPEAEAGGEELPKKKGGFQRTIDKQKGEIEQLTRAKYEKELEAEQLRRELAKHVTKPDLTADPGPKPTIDQFKTVDEYDAAMESWGEHKGFHKAQLEAKQRTDLEAMRTATAALRTREDAAAAKYPDYEQTVLGIAEIVKQTPVLSQYVLHSEMAPDVAYHLAKNPAVLQGLLHQDTFSMVRELTRLEAKLSAAPPPKPLTTAPAPIKPVGARESVPVTLGDLAKSHDIGAYVAKANARGKP